VSDRSFVIRAFGPPSSFVIRASLLSSVSNERGLTESNELTLFASSNEKPQQPQHDLVILAHGNPTDVGPNEWILTIQDDRPPRFSVYGWWLKAKQPGPCDPGC